MARATTAGNEREDTSKRSERCTIKTPLERERAPPLSFETISLFSSKLSFPESMSPTGHHVNDIIQCCLILAGLTKLGSIS